MVDIPAGARNIEVRDATLTDHFIGKSVCFVTLT